MGSTDENFMEIYERQIDMGFSTDPSVHFPTFIKYYEGFDENYKIRSLEAILIIYRLQAHYLDNLTTNHGRYIIYDFKQGKRRSSKFQQGKSRLIEIANWLKNTLLNEKNEAILRTFHIFYQTRINSIANIFEFAGKKLQEVHESLLDNVKYAKYPAKERLLGSSFYS